MNRQSKTYAREGIEIDVSTLADRVDSMSSPIPDVHRAVAAALGAIRDSRRLAKLMFDTPTFDLLASAYLSRSPPEFKWDLDRFKRAFRKDIGDR